MDEKTTFGGPGHDLDADGFRPGTAPPAEIEASTPEEQADKKEPTETLAPADEQEAPASKVEPPAEDQDGKTETPDGKTETPVSEEETH